MLNSVPETCIYIVDDESALANMAGQILSLNGYRAKIFGDPLDALEHLKSFPKESVLLITDCIMGNMNGLELIEEFQKHVKDLRTILLSGTISPEFVQKCQVQPDRFLSKPYPADRLLSLVEELAGGSPSASGA